MCIFINLVQYIFFISYCSCLVIRVFLWLNTAMERHSLKLSHAPIAGKPDGIPNIDETGLKVEAMSSF